jgi:hypothetical protein
MMMQEAERSEIEILLRAETAPHSVEVDPLLFEFYESRIALIFHMTDNRKAMYRNLCMGVGS